MKFSWVCWPTEFPIEYCSLKFLQIQQIPLSTPTVAQRLAISPWRSELVLRQLRLIQQTYYSLPPPPYPNCNQGLPFWPCFCPRSQWSQKIYPGCLCWDWLECREISNLWAQVPLPAGRALWAKLLPVALSVIRTLSWHPSDSFNQTSAFLWLQMRPRRFWKRRWELRTLLPVCPTQVWFLFLFFCFFTVLALQYTKPCMLYWTTLNWYS